MSSTDARMPGDGTESTIERLLPRARLVGSRSDLAFRTLLDTTSRPGLVGRFVDPQFVGIPFVLLPALALANVDTRIAVVGAADPTESQSWQVLVCRATDSQSTKLSSADIVTVMGRLDVAWLASLRPGTPEKPERAARLVLACDALFEANGTSPIDGTEDDGAVLLELRGPGVDGFSQLVVVGVPVETFERLAIINGEPSCGVDVHLVDQSGRMVSLPRSTDITVLRAQTAEPALSTSNP